FQLVVQVRRVLENLVRDRRFLAFAFLTGIPGVCQPCQQLLRLVEQLLVLLLAEFQRHHSPSPSTSSTLPQASRAPARQPMSCSVMSMSPRPTHLPHETIFCSFSVSAASNFCRFVSLPACGPISFISTSAASAISPAGRRCAIASPSFRRSWIHFMYMG